MPRDPNDRTDYTGDFTGDYTKPFTTPQMNTMRPPKRRRPKDELAQPSQTDSQEGESNMPTGRRAADDNPGATPKGWANPSGKGGEERVDNKAIEDKKQRDTAREIDKDNREPDNSGENPAQPGGYEYKDSHKMTGAVGHWICVDAGWDLAQWPSELEDSYVIYLETGRFLRGEHLVSNSEDLCPEHGDPVNRSRANLNLSRTQITGRVKGSYMISRVFTTKSSPSVVGSRVLLRDKRDGYHVAGRVADVEEEAFLVQWEDGDTTKEPKEEYDLIEFAE